MDNVLERQDLNISEKNALYNSVLRQFIKKLKYVAEKPLDVKVSNESIPFKNDDLETTVKEMSNILQTMQPRQTSPVPKKKQRKNAPTTTPLPPPAPLPPPVPLMQNIETQTEDIVSTPRRKLKPNKSNTTPRKSKNDPILGADSSEKFNRKLRANIKEKVSDRIIGLADHLMENRDKFNLNEKGQVENKGKTVPNSSHIDIAEYIVKGSTQMRTPPGYKNISKQLNDDKQVKKFKVSDWSK
uniref:Uncharacterized protein n=1 Tax=Panagrolaimus davidi TaxID=227884 RepID=A0A914QKL5_9BILA